MRFDSALDIGCGLGRLIDEWNNSGIDAWGVDISRNAITHDKVVYACLWEMKWKQRFDFGICTDVMEHIPEEYVRPTLAHISKCCKQVLFKIAHEHNQLDGEVLHLTRRPTAWWLKQLDWVGGKSIFLGTQLRSGQQDSLVRWELP